MRALGSVAVYELRNVVRSRWALMYALFFFVLTDSLFRFMGDSSRVTLSLINISLLVVPLVSALFGAMNFYSGREFIE
ncbi:MAG: nitrous-oxide metabolic protein NosY, partial [Candidatus Zixiibacteriota bacterium]